jgi:glycerol-3-phosphate acyltransferase PlsX
LAGAIEAAHAAQDRIELILVGPEATIREQLGALQPGTIPFRFVDAPGVIDMHDSATSGLRQKKNSSINVGITLHKEGNADAFVSAGHSGAVLSLSTLILGRIEGISRPTIGAFFPSERGVCLLLDAGANVDCKPQHLYEFALMGSIYAHEMFGISTPTVGLLNIGEEDSKGNEAAREAHQLLRKSALNFIGNVEGRDILAGKAQVVVCDGFVGNIILKFGESVPAFFKSRLKEVAAQSVVAKLVAGLMRPTLRTALKSMDYEEHGGVPVLGVNGVSIIGHGKSTPKAIRNMILKAEEMVRKQINTHIREALAR